MGRLICIFGLISSVLLWSTSIISCQQPLRIPATKFTCQGRASGYYADVDAGCQVYHMCDGLGRQFSYSCPNTTLFQQRMLVCDHWYMVNCTNSPSEYHANLLIGQRDKPFVSEHENHQRTPRPDILSVPYSNNYYDGLKEAETKYHKHPSNSIVGAVDTINPHSNNDLDEGTSHYAVPSHWSTHSGNQPSKNIQNNDFDKRHAISTTPRSAASQVGNDKSPRDYSSYQQTNLNNQHSNSNIQQSNFNTQHTNGNRPDINIDENDDIHINFHQQTTSTPDPEEYPQIDIRSNFNRGSGLINTFNIKQQSTSEYARTTEKNIPSPANQFSRNTNIQSPNSNEHSDLNNGNSADDNKEGVIDFFNKFKPTDAGKSNSMTQAEILSINGELPKGSTNSEEDDNKSFSPDYETQVSLDTSNQIFTSKDNLDDISKNAATSKQPHSKPSVTVDRKKIDVSTVSNNLGINEISRELLPPKEDYLKSPSSTMGPPIYYEWKWAAPAFDLKPPKQGNEKHDSSDLPKQENTSTDITTKGKLSVQTGNQVTQRSLNLGTSTQKTTEYKLGSYFVPDYTFPLDKAHPGYAEEDSQTSFQVRIPDNWKSGNTKTSYYGENEKCPQCHPAYVVPGTCEPCIRR